jgi:hypothetical protein
MRQAIRHHIDVQIGVAQSPEVGALSEDGLLVQARGNSWRQLIFKDLIKFD